MSWRTVCITKRCKLEYRMGYMVVRSDEIKRIHLDEIGVLIIESTAVSLTSSLLCELNKNKTKVIFCDEKHNPHSELLGYYGSHDTSKVIRQQINWSDEIKNLVWMIIIKDKILKQAKVLSKFDKQAQSTLLMSYLPDVLPGDISNREGHAAKVYFNALFGMNFSRNDTCFINSALNYGYTIMLACFNREVVAQGCVTQIGIWHDNVFNYFNLSSDLMEAFRPFVDLQILEICTDFSDDILSSEVKHKILNILEAEILINGEYCRLPNAIRIYCRSVINALHEQNLNLMPIITYV